MKGKSKDKKSNLDALLNDAVNILTAPVEDNQAKQNL